jgi:hydroxyacylglutathione hydrolase
VYRVVTGPLEENTYVVSHLNGDAIVVDPGGDFDQIKAHVDAAELRVHAVLNTHGHADHLGAAAEVIGEYGASFHLHPRDEYFLPRTNFYRAAMYRLGPVDVPEVEVRLADGMSLAFGEIRVDVIHTPGHTPGSVCFALEGELFTGDTLTATQVGGTELPGGDRKALDASIAFIVDHFSPHTTMRPGHGEPARLGDVISRLAERTEGPGQ